MAGAGYKLFNTGDVLTAAQVNTYLQEQVVMVFADATARTTALSGVLAEGMVSYLKDTNATEVYDGSAWVGIGNSGDITGVTAGTGISGGGTSGTVTITNSMATAIDAKGDLIVGTGADTFDRLAVGTNGHTLVADSSTATGLKWAAAAGGGKVLQVVSDTDTSDTTISSTTFTDTGLSLTITPSLATSKILILSFFRGSVYNGATDTDCYAESRLLRDATQIQGHYPGINTMASVTNPRIYYSISYVCLDNPSTTSAITYKIQNRANTNTSTSISVDAAGGLTAYLVAMEIGA